MIIRNSSYYFGRDRMSEAAYVSFEPVSVEELQALEPVQLGKKYIPWRDVVNAPLSLPLDQRGKRALDLVKGLEDFNLRFNQWQRSEGASEFLDLLAAKVDSAPMYLGIIEGSAPSWQPTSVQKVTPELIQTLRTKGLEATLTGFTAKSRIILMASPNGDLP
jgi:hypothetical protein